MPLAFTNQPATVGEASRPLAAPFWAGSAPRTPTKSDADADADADYISTMPAPPQTYYGRRRCVLAAALAFVLCGAVPAPRETPPEPKKDFPWVPVAVAGAGAVALARPEVRAGRALASLGRGVVIGAFPA